MVGAVLVGTRMDLAVTDGADLTGVLTGEAAGREPLQLPVPIEELLEAHARWVETDGREGKPADLSGMDLRGVAALGSRPLTALIAPDAIFYGLNLEGASLQGSNLQNADLRSVRLVGADLRGVNLVGAKLNYADLRDAKIGPLMISDDRLLPSRLDNVMARYADFRGADLRRASLIGSALAYANLTDANLRDTDTEDTDFTGAKLPVMFVENAAAAG